ncbi:MAG: hypothetical protein AB9836_04505 [Aminipila sp.]
MKGIKNLSANTFSANKNDERGRLIACGRMLMRDHNVSLINSKGKGNEKIALLLQDKSQYESVNEGFKLKLFNFAGKVMAANSGEHWERKEKIEDFKDPALFRDTAFLKALSAVMRDVVNPITPAAMSDMVGKFMKVTTIGYKDNYEIDITSNAIFNFYETAWGVNYGVPQYLYADTIKADPQPIEATAKINWYQTIISRGDMGEIFNAISEGLLAYGMGRFQQVFKKASANPQFVPAPYKATAYSSANFLRVAQNVGIANRSKVSCFGMLPALGCVLPEVASNLRDGISAEWCKAGYISNYKSVDLYELQNAFVPNTVNTTAQHVVEDDVLWIAGTNSKAPVEMVLEGGKIMTELEPGKTADMTSVVTIKASADVIPVFGSRMGVITNVVEA